MNFENSMLILGEAHAGLTSEALKGIVQGFDEAPAPLRETEDAVKHMREVGQKINAVRSALLNPGGNDMSDFQRAVLFPIVKKLRSNLEDVIAEYFRAVRENLVAELIK